MLDKTSNRIETEFDITSLTPLDVDNFAQMEWDELIQIVSNYMNYQLEVHPILGEQDSQDTSFLLYEKQIKLSIVSFITDKDGRMLLTTCMTNEFDDEIKSKYIYFVLKDIWLQLNREDYSSTDPDDQDVLSKFKTVDFKPGFDDLPNFKDIFNRLKVLLGEINITMDEIIQEYKKSDIFNRSTFNTYTNLPIDRENAVDGPPSEKISCIDFVVLELLKKRFGLESIDFSVLFAIATIRQMFEEMRPLINNIYIESIQVPNIFYKGKGKKAHIPIRVKIGLKTQIPSDTDVSLINNTTVTRTQDRINISAVLPYGFLPTTDISVTFLDPLDAFYDFRNSNAADEQRKEKVEKLIRISATDEIYKEIPEEIILYIWDIFQIANIQKAA